jgi:hypothetical protein
MINERAGLIWRRKGERLDLLRRKRPASKVPFERISGMSGTLAFFLGAGCLSAVIYWLSTRAENSAGRRPAGDGYSSSDYTSTSSSGGWNIANWFSSDNSGSNCSSDNSSSSSDSCSSGGGDSGGGGDGGGGGD